MEGYQFVQRTFPALPRSKQHLPGLSSAHPQALAIADAVATAAAVVVVDTPVVAAVVDDTADCIAAGVTAAVAVGAGCRRCGCGNPTRSQPVVVAVVVVVVSAAVAAAVTMHR